VGEINCLNTRTILFEIVIRMLVCNNLLKNSSGKRQRL
jgi:hypothetical protein